MPRDAIARPFCGARRKHNRGFCQSPPLKGHWRCRMHGGASTGAKTPEGKARGVAARVAGRAKWVERMRRAKAAGLVDRFPGGRHRGRKPRPKTGNKLADRALRQIAETLEHLAAPMADKPFKDLEPGEQLADITRQSLKVLHELLLAPAGPENPKLARMVSDAARCVLALSVKVDPQRMRARRPGRMLELLERLRL
jgi:hypothetical protein